MTIRLGMRSERGLIRHLIYLAEACSLRKQLVARGTRHVHAHFASNAADIAVCAISSMGFLIVSQFTVRKTSTHRVLSAFARKFITPTSSLLSASTLEGSFTAGLHWKIGTRFA